MNHQIPELLSPAGSLEKLKVAVLYGADAVYVAGRDFGLRAASENLTHGQLAQGVEFAHQRGAQVYVALNGFLHDQDLKQLPQFCHFLQSIGVDAVICSDLGVIATVGEHGELPIHLSTQASCLNSSSAKLWGRMGIARLILGREVSLKEAQRIKQETGLSIELFVHGSLCTSYSGNCVISNYTAGRDSNRGGCAHSCRFEYTLEHSSHRERSHFMSSKDLQGLELLGQYIAAGVDSIKIEGRMKGAIYAATTSKVYREALDCYRNLGIEEWHPLEKWQRELRTFSHRDYTQASLLFPAGLESIHNQREELRQRSHDVLGTVVATDGEEMVVSVKNLFDRKSCVELLPFRGPAISLPSLDIQSLGRKPLEQARPSTLVRLPAIREAQQWNMLRSPQC